MRQPCYFLLPVMCVLLTLTAGLRSGEPPAMPQARPIPEIRFVPQEDLSRAEGYSDAGVFLPLSELMALVRAAGERGAQETAPDAVTCTGIHLRGALSPAPGGPDSDHGLALDGTVSFEAPSAKWSATLIETGEMPWTSQQLLDPLKGDVGAKDRPLAFLARIDGRTWLFARGPFEGRLSVTALLNTDVVRIYNATLNFGVFFAPTVIELMLPAEISLGASSVPAEVELVPEGRLLRVWPAQPGGAFVQLLRSPPVTVPSALRIQDDLRVVAGTGGMSFEETLVLEDRFTSGSSVSLTLPSGLQLLRMRTDAPCVMRANGQQLTLTPKENLERIEIGLQFGANLDEGGVRIGSWGTSAVAVRSSLTLEPSETHVPVLAEISDTFVAGEAGAPGVRKYFVDGPLPPFEIALVKAGHSSPPTVAAKLAVGVGEATAEYLLQLEESNTSELVLTLPKSWVLTALDAVRAGEKTPVAFQPQRDNEWRLAWPSAATRPDVVVVSLRRSGDWGMAGSTHELDLPLVSFAAGRPARFEMSVFWPMELEVEAAQVEGLEIIPVAEAHESAMTPDVEKARLAFRATAAAPSGRLLIRGKAADVRAVTVTSLNVAEDSATVRALLAYEVQFAAVNTFRFILPPGTGGGIKVDGDGIRESTMRPIPSGEEWTIVTQRGVLGGFPLHVEWPIATTSPESPVAVPVIQVSGVSSQRGYVMIEGSESLRLTMRAKGLAEADLSEVPPVPWASQARTLAVYRYAAPRFELMVRPERLPAERGLGGIARNARLATTLAADGTRFTRARYSIPSSGAGQFFELHPPLGADVWGALVDGRGTKPARRPGPHGDSVLMIPLPPASDRVADLQVEVLYRERSLPLGATLNLVMEGPRLAIPVNRTQWDLNLPSGFEYLAYGGSLANWATVRQPFITFIRTAYYPRQIVLEGWSLRSIAVLTVLLAVLWMLFRKLRRWLGFAAFRLRILEVMIVLGVIAVLAAISVPNFLEAQVRSKSSRVKADLRSVATAVESYYLDNGFYPTDAEVLWQGPVKYLASAFADPYGQSGGYASYGSGPATYRYLRGPDAFSRAVESGLIAWDPSAAPPRDFYMIWSNGPDGRDDGGRILYDPTNGSVSAGDIVRVWQGGPDSGKDAAILGQKASAYGGHALSEVGYPAEGMEGKPRREPEGQPVPVLEGRMEADSKKRDEIGERVERRLQQEKQKNEVSASEEPSIAEEVARLNKRLAQMDKRIGGVVPGSTPLSGERGDGPKESGAGSRAPSSPPAGAPEITEPGDWGAGQDEPASQEFAFSDAFDQDSAASARQAGLLSLGIELPEAGIQRTFEGLTGEARVEIRLMPDTTFRRISFVVWISMFSVLGWVWRKRRAHYRATFLVALIISLLPPVLMETAYVAFFNSAFQGAVFSLVFPFVSWIIRRQRLDLAPPAPTLPVWIFVLGIASGIRAEPADATQEGVHALSAPAASAPSVEPVRILVPYSGDLPETARESVWEDQGTSSPLGFMSRADFTRLWNAVHVPRPKLPAPDAVLESLTLEGQLQVESGVIEGVLRLRVVNPNDLPTSLPMLLSQLRVRGQLHDKTTPSNSSEGLNASNPAEGISLVHADDGMRLVLEPHGAWEVALEFTLPCVMRGASGGFELDFPEVASGLWRVQLPYTVRPNPAPAGFITRNLGDSAELTGAVRPGRLAVRWNAGRAVEVRPDAAVTEAEWRADATTGIVWDSLESADWQCRLKLDAAPGATSLPEVILLDIPPNLRLYSVTGPSLISAKISDSRLEMRLVPGREAHVLLAGIVLPSSDAWAIEGLRPPHGASIRTYVQLEIADALEILSSDMEGLERKPAQNPARGATAQAYQAEADWRIRLALRSRRPVFDAVIGELVIPGQGWLRRAAKIVITPQGGVLDECVLSLPKAARLDWAESSQPASWVQHGERVMLTFQPPISQPAAFLLRSSADFPADATELTVLPLDIPSARNLERRLMVGVPPDVELVEVGLEGAQSATISEDDSFLMTLLDRSDVVQAAPPVLPRLYRLRSGAPLRFALRPVADSRPIVKIFNRVSMSEGLQSLEVVVRARPRIGRLRSLDFRLLLPSPSPDAAARLRVEGPVRSIRVTPESEMALGVGVVLDAPASDEVEVRFTLEEPASVEAESSTGPVVMLPVQTDGSRVFLLLHHEFEGELVPVNTQGARPADAAEIGWPSARFNVMPSDLIYELAPDAASAPVFSIRRHARQESLRAVVESLRNRVIVTSDGVERHELEIVLQNESEQFLLVALPHEHDRIEVYETLVAGRSVHTAFVKEEGRDALAVPLIRTGLLEPELHVRIAYKVKSGEVLSGSGRRRQRLPDILGGVPVTQSALILMLPADFIYDDFEGSLERVDMVDLNLDAAERMAKTSEKLTQAALYSSGAVQQAAVSKLSQYQAQVTSEIENATVNLGAQQRVEQQMFREFDDAVAQADEIRKRAGERENKLQRAQEALSNAYANIKTLSTRDAQEQSQLADGGENPLRESAAMERSGRIGPVASPTPRPTVVPMEFPRAGETFVFRQIQGTGAIEFGYASRKASGRRNDILTALGLLLAVFALGRFVRELAWTRRRIAMVIFLPAVVAAGLGVLIDLAVPLAVFAILLWISDGRSSAEPAS